MKETVIFISSWIATWLLFTAIGWFATPGCDFRVMAGDAVVGTFTIILGWIPGTIIVLDDKKK